MNISYLQDLSSESKRLGEHLKELINDEVYYAEILAKAPLAEMMLINIKTKKDKIQKQLDEITKQANQARMQVGLANAFVAAVKGGMKG